MILNTRIIVCLYVSVFFVFKSNKCINMQAKHVINYDFPVYMADYIHRCGRTGRVGSDDNCLITNFVSGDREVDLVQKIEVSTTVNHKQHS